MAHPWPALLRKAWVDRPLRQKLALAVWLTVVPISLASSMVALQHARQMVEARVRQQLVWDAEQASAYLSFWDQNHLHNLTLLSKNDRIRELDPQSVGPVLDEMYRLFPAFSYSVNRPDGTTVDRAGLATLPVEPRLISALMRQPSTTYAQALKGVNSTSILIPPYVNDPCVVSSVPVYSTASPETTPVAGLISTCLPLAKLGWITGINALIQSASSAKGALPLIDFEAGKPYGYAMLMVFGPDSFIVLGNNINDSHQLSRLDPRRVASTSWQPLVDLAWMSKSSTSFYTATVRGVPYFVGIDRRKKGRTVMMVVDQRSAFATINDLFKWIWIGTIVALSVSSIAVVRICRSLAKPIDQAGLALSRISRGEFDGPLPTDSSDVGRLFAYVNAASAQLQAFLNEAKQHAITDAQLVEARRIQSDFLIQDLPSSAHVDLAALCQPAYQIGADWYDAIKLDGITFIVVADVCDKGVPSALYMSVFRSLLRLSLIKEWQQHQSVESTLCQAVTTVNQYMAETHGHTGMFATAFIGAVDATAGRLHHVVAGHEPPLILRDNQLSALTIGGPAVGIFSGAVFQASWCAFASGSLLLAFSDGLPDARNPEAIRFGDQRLQTIVQEQLSSNWSAQALIDRLYDAVTTYVNGAEQFDDLTLLAVKAL